jgi:hypothetical protein
MLRTLPDTESGYNFSVGVLDLMHDGSRIMRTEASNVIDSCLYTMFICVTFISVICVIPHVDCCDIVVCWIQVISII